MRNLLKVSWDRLSRNKSCIPTPATIPSAVKKVRLADNERMNDKEFKVACALCDIATEVIRAGNATSPGGIFWGGVNSNAALAIHLRKNRREIDASILLHNRFRDFPTIIYAHDNLTPKPDFWVRRYIRLCEGIAPQWRVQIPAQFGEIGWNVGGFPVNRHTAFLQERVNAQLYFGMERLLSSSPCPRALEIGGGSGEMAYAICKNTPGITWYDCDLTQSLIYNAIHMAMWLPGKKHYIYVGNLPVTGIDEKYILRSADEAAKVENAVVNIPHFLLADFTGKLTVNMALNAWSFSEMPGSEVQRYGKFIRDHLTKEGALIEQNGTHADKGGCNAKDILRTIFPERKEFFNPPLSGHGIIGGPIDAWSLSPVITDGQVIMDSFNNHGDKDDLRFSPGDYGLLLESEWVGIEKF